MRNSPDTPPVSSAMRTTPDAQRSNTALPNSAANPTRSASHEAPDRVPFLRLSLRNLRVSLQDFSIYFITQVLGVAIFYAFNATASTLHERDLSAMQERMVNLLDTAVKVISVLVGIVLAFLIIYANHFLLRRRKKELGTYLILGMRRGQVSRMIVIESFLVGMAALAAGLLLGIAVSQVLSSVAANLFMAPMDDFVIAVSAKAVGLTCGFFCAVFAASIVLNLIVMNARRLVTLLRGDSTNATNALRNVPISVAVFAVGVAAAAWGGWLITEAELNPTERTSWIAGALCLLGTVLIFWGAAGALLVGAKRFPRFYLREKNLVALRGVGARVNQAFISLSVICLMLFVSFTCLSAGLSMMITENRHIASISQRDVSMNATFSSNYGADSRRPPHGEAIAAHDAPIATPDLYAELTARMPSIAEVIGEHVQVATYLAGMPTLDTALSTGGNAEAAYTAQCGAKASNAHIFRKPVEVVPASSVNAMLATSDKPQLSLSGNDTVLWIRSVTCPTYWEQEMSTPHTFSALGSQLQSTTAKFTDGSTGENYVTDIDGMFAGAGTLIVSDEWFHQHESELYVAQISLSLMYNTSRKEGDRALLAAVRPYQYDVTHPDSAVVLSDLLPPTLGGTDSLWILWTTAQMLVEQSRGTVAIYAFIAMYISIVMLIAATSILALQQLTDAATDIPRYQLLERLGTTRQAITGILARRVGIFFFLPAVVALAYTGIILNAFLKQATVHFPDFDHATWAIPLAAALGVYCLYYLATVATARSIVHRARVERTG